MLRGKENLASVLERGRLSVKLSAAALVLSAGLFVTIFLTASWGGIGVFKLGLIPFGAAMIFSLASLIQGAFFSRMVREEEEKQLLERRKEKLNSILDVSEDVRFTAGRMYGNFRKYVPSSISLLSFVLMTLALVFLWREFHQDPALMMGSLKPVHPVNLAFLCSIGLVVSFFFGVFLIGQSHISEFRWLRPAGAWLIVGGMVMLLSGLAALLMASAEAAKAVDRILWEVHFFNIVFFIFCVLALEFLLNFVVEFYRPRTQLEDRPVYESRLLALFLEPGGVVRNIADSLDYQFGFKVSRTWIYTFFERSIIPALILWGFVLWLFTGIAQVNPGELGIRERFGAFVPGKEVLQPGIHLKWPWPIEHIVRVPVDRMQQFVIGAHMDKLKDTKTMQNASVVLWTGQHYMKEDGFLVANVEKGLNDIAFPVSILEAALPVSYRVRPGQVYDYAFNFEDVNEILTLTGESEATAYFASTDFMKDISFGREEVARHLQARIQNAADRLNIGVDIICVNLHDAHPPIGGTTAGEAPDESGGVNVAAAFQDVVCAQEEALTEEYKADAYSAETVESAKVEALKIVSDAEAYQYDTATVAMAEAVRFNSQLTAYRALPFMFRLRTYLDFLENDCAHLRKYVLSERLKSQIYELNMEEKPRLDLLDADLGELGK